MATSSTTTKKPFWLSIEENILALNSQDLSGGNLEASIQRIAGELDNAGFNVSHHGGNMLQLRWAMDETHKVGRPFLADFNTAIGALTLEDMEDLYFTANKLIQDMGETWPGLKRSERRSDVIGFVEKAKLDLLIVKAKGMPDDKGIRFLIEKSVLSEVISSALDITEEKLKQVNAEMEAEHAEIARVEKLLEAVEGKSDEEKVKHLFTNNVAEDLIIGLA